MLFRRSLTNLRRAAQLRNRISSASSASTSAFATTPISPCSSLKRQLTKRAFAHSSSSNFSHAQLAESEEEEYVRARMNDANDSPLGGCESSFNGIHQSSPSTEKNKNENKNKNNNNNNSAALTFSATNLEKVLRFRGEEGGEEEGGRKMTTKQKKKKITNNNNNNNNTNTNTNIAKKKRFIGNVPEYVCSSSFTSVAAAATKKCDETTSTVLCRSESDLLGELDTIPRNALYGIATQRAVENYPITGVKLSHFPEFIRALAFVKKAAATANFKVGLISKEIFEAISTACDSLLDSNKYHGDFIVDVIQGGAGTSTNMAANEIIANLANLSLNKPIGSYEVVHPNDHVNLCQSTNDAYPTAAKLAVGLHHEKMVSELKLLIESFRKKGDEFKDIVKMGRTQLQDAVPMTLGQEFASFANSLESDLAYLMKNVNALYECNLGGTAIGTSITAHKEFSKESIDALRQLTKLPFTSAKDFVEASSSTSSFLLFSSILRRIALKTSKICNDLRLLSSGPRCGFNEIDLPAVAPGSSIMPGKINPVIPEVMNQVCFQVIGSDAAISMASEHAQLQLNAFEPVIVYNLLNSLDSMSNGLKVLREKCIDGITANEDVCASHVNNSIGIVTALLPKIGYKKATLVAKTALETNKPVSHVATEVLNFLSQEDADTLLNIENMTGVVAGDKEAEEKRKSYPKRGVDIESPQSAGGKKCNLWSYMYPPERQLFQSAGVM